MASDPAERDGDDESRFVAPAPPRVGPPPRLDKRPRPPPVAGGSAETVSPAPTTTTERADVKQSVPPKVDKTERVKVRPPGQLAQKPPGPDESLLEILDPKTSKVDLSAPRPAPRRPPLPRPGAMREGAASGRPRGDFREPPRKTPPPSPRAAPPPKGIKPPTLSADELERKDTRALISAVAVELMAEEMANEEAAAAAAPGASTAPTATATAAEAATPVVVPTDHTDVAANRKPIWMYVVAGLAATFLFVWIVMPGDEDGASEHVQTDAKPSQASHVAQKKTESDLAVPKAKPSPKPLVVALAEDDPQALAEPYGPDEPEPDEIAIVEPEPEPVVEAVAVVPPPTPQATPSPSPRKGKSKGKAKSRGRGKNKSKAKSKPPRKSNAASSAPPPASTRSTSKPKAEPTASELLTQATRALSKGQANTAYNLAAKSQRKKPRSAALKIMVKAACKMKNKSKARTAFNRLPVGARGGLRPYCRDRGVRLGI